MNSLNKCHKSIDPVLQLRRFVSPFPLLVHQPIVLSCLVLSSMRIDRYVGNFLLFVLISFVIFTLVFTYREFKRLLKTDLKEYMTAFWTWVEIAQLGLSSVF